MYLAPEKNKLLKSIIVLAVTRSPKLIAAGGIIRRGERERGVQKFSKSIEGGLLLRTLKYYYGRQNHHFIPSVSFSDHTVILFCYYCYTFKDSGDRYLKNGLSKTIAHVIQHANFHPYRVHLTLQLTSPYLEKPTNNDKYINKRERLFIQQTMCVSKKCVFQTICVQKKKY